jgi:anti-sigma factor (TIGR02949 family)
MQEQDSGAEPVSRVSATGCDCDEAVAELWAYLDSELEPIEAARVKEHLDGCRGCLEEYDVEVVVKKLVRRCWSDEEAAPTDLRARIHATLTTIQVRGR